MRKCVFSAIICLALLIGTGGAVMAQTVANPVLTGYFVGIGGRQAGPFDTAGLRELIDTGQLTRDSLVWREGMPNWVAAGTVEELSQLFAAVPPPLPGAQAAPPPLPTAPPPSIWAEQFAITPVQAGFQDFTFGQRWATFLLNSAIPGLGSFIIMRDTAGGLFNIALGVGAYAGYILYVSTIRWHWQGGHVWRQSFPVFWIAGLGLHLGQFVHNAVRSFTFTRPLPPGLAFFLDNDIFDIALVPGQNGTTGVAFTVTLRY